MIQKLLRLITCFVCLALFNVSLQSSPVLLDNGETRVYAFESLASVDEAVVIADTSDELELSMTVDFSISIDPKYARIDLINTSFEAALDSSGFNTDPNYESLLLSGGQVGDTFAIISLTASNSQGPNTELVLSSSSFLIDDPQSPAQIRYRLYDSAGAAVNLGDEIVSKTFTFAEFKTGISEFYVTSSTQYVDINEDFLRFKPSFRSPFSFEFGDATETLASVAFFDQSRLISSDLLDYQTSLAITDIRGLLTNYDSSADTLQISGTFSSLNTFLAQNEDCTGSQVALSPNNGVALFSLDDLVTQPYFCLQATSNTDVISRSEFTLDLGFGPEPRLLAKVLYNAVSIDFPYITDFENLRQRIYMTNFADREVKYYFEFISETGSENQFTLTDTVAGMVPAKSTLKLNSTDLVDIFSGVAPRISARLYIDTTPSEIAVATQLISLLSDAPPVTSELEIRSN